MARSNKTKTQGKEDAAVSIMSLRVPAPLMDEIKELARVERRTITAQLILLIEKSLGRL